MSIMAPVMGPQQRKTAALAELAAEKTRLDEMHQAAQDQRDRVHRLALIAHDELGALTAEIAVPLRVTDSRVSQIIAEQRDTRCHPSAA